MRLISSNGAYFGLIAGPIVGLGGQRLGCYLKSQPHEHPAVTAYAVRPCGSPHALKTAMLDKRGDDAAGCSRTREESVGYGLDVHVDHCITASRSGNREHLQHRPFVGGNADSSSPFARCHGRRRVRLCGLLSGRYFPRLRVTFEVRIAQNFLEAVNPKLGEVIDGPLRTITEALWL